MQPLMAEEALHTQRSRSSRSTLVKLLGQKFISQRQLQVVCGGLVYFSMFRRR